jgi:hypothetical protein
VADALARERRAKAMAAASEEAAVKALALAEKSEAAATEREVGFPYCNSTAPIETPVGL